MGDTVSFGSKFFDTQTSFYNNTEEVCNDLIKRRQNIVHAHNCPGSEGSNSSSSICDRTCHNESEMSKTMTKRTTCREAVQICMMHSSVQVYWSGSTKKMQCRLAEVIVDSEKTGHG